MVLFKRRVTNQGVRPAGSRQFRARAKTEIPGPDKNH